MIDKLHTLNSPNKSSKCILYRTVRSTTRAFGAKKLCYTRIVIIREEYGDSN